MRVTRIIIKNLFGIKECTLDGNSIELTGPKGSGKTSVLDAIRYALTNRSSRDLIIHKGADEGEIIIETDTGLVVDRKTRTNKADSIRVRDGSLTYTRPAEFLNSIFTPLQLNPIEFTQMSRQEKNRVILSLIEFDWDMNWIKEQFGEIPQGVDYNKHILEVLADIQSEKGVYYQTRQDINRDIRNNQALIAEIAQSLPDNYNYEKWESYNLGEKYRELERLRHENSLVERAVIFQRQHADKLRGLEAEKEIAISAAERAINNERDDLNKTIERLRAELKAAEDKLTTLNGKLSDKIAVIEAEYREKVAKLEKEFALASEYANRPVHDISALQAEINMAEEMKKHLNEYRRMVEKQAETARLSEKSNELTNKIELARELPAKILAEATLPIKGLTVENGVPLINGLPISNLSDGELLELCVDITVSRPGQLGIVLIDGAERLDTESRERLYQHCKDKGLQVIASRVTDSNVFEVVEL